VTVPAAVKVAVATGAYTTELRELPVPAVGPDDGLLRVEAAAVCGTDWETYGRRSRGAGLGPLVLGHENVGRVAALGERAAARWGVAVGDRVAVEEFLPCGACPLCRRGLYRLCPATDSRGSGPYLRYGSTPITVEPGLYGGFAELMYLHPRAIVYPVGDAVAPELAALYVPIANGVNWVTQEGGLRLGGTLAVIGPGQHGLGCVVAAREAGAAAIAVIGTAADRHRLDVAAALGADATFVAGVDDVVAGVRELTGGGADLVIDLAPGATGTVADAVAMAGVRGTVGLASSKHGQPVAVPHDLVVRRELRMLGLRGHDGRSVRPALELIRSGRHRLDLLTTHRFPLAATADALTLAGERADPAAIHVSVLP
jgi:threonine dehydrogenase-like Zn-dependent dehydrogenase